MPLISLVLNMYFSSQKPVFPGGLCLDLPGIPVYSKKVNNNKQPLRKEGNTMQTIQVSLGSIETVKQFVYDLCRFDCDFDLISGRYVIDAKSILGIFSLDLSKPIDLTIHADGAQLEEVLKAMEPYKV